MRVLRIQDARTGAGLYQKCVYEAGLDLNEPRYHPAPRCDSGLGPEAMNFLYGNQELARFGFADEVQLRRWLYRDTWLMTLHNVGAELVEYEVTGQNTYVGHTQVIFDITQATVVDRRPLTTLI